LRGSKGVGVTIESYEKVETLLKRSGGLTNESKEKAEILSNQFKSVFTKPRTNISTTVLPQLAGSTIQNLKITVDGVEKLLKCDP
jgi:hypothetical protein